MKSDFGSYQLGAKLAEGGMAEVFLAKKIGAGDWELPVVVKRMLPPFNDHPEYRRLFFAEARVATKVSHANIAQVYDYCEVDGALCLVFEYIAGRNLAALAQRCPGMPWHLAVHLLAQALEALAYLHSRPQPILHGDISPHNLMVTTDGCLKLIDFGVARMAGGQKQGEIFFGKPGYMPPESLSGSVYEQRSEVWALALVIFEAITGASKSTREVQRELLARSVPDGLISILVKGLESDPNQRFKDAGVMKEALGNWLMTQSWFGQRVAQEFEPWFTALFPDGDCERTMDVEATTRLKGTVRKALPSRWQLGLGIVLVLLTVGLLANSFGWLSQNTTNERPKMVGVAPPVTNKKEVPEVGGELVVDSHPWSSVYLNGRYLGVTPLQQKDVPPGSYSLFFVSADGRRYERTIKVVAGQRLRVFHQMP